MRRLLLLLALFTALPVTSAAAQSPADCTGSGLDIAVAWDSGKGRIGLPSTLTVGVAQPGAKACDVSGMTIQVQLPGPDGQPSTTTATLADRVTYRHDMAPVTLSAAPWTVALSPGVTTAAARVSWSGTLRDVADSPISGSKLMSLDIAEPKLGFTVTADPATGTVPLDVTYRFRLTNEGTPPDPLTSVAIAHPNCTPVRQNGDTDGDDALDAGEIWNYACTHRFTTPVEHTATSNANAISTSDARGVTAPPVNTVVRAVAPTEPLGRLTLTTTADPPSGLAPLAVTHTYTVRNDGTGPVKDVTVADGGCSPVTTTAPNTPLEPAGARTFTCSRVFGTVGTFRLGALASGTDATTGRLVSTGQITTEITTTAAPAVTATPTAPATPEPETTSTPTPTPTPTAKPSARVSFTASGRFARPCRGRVALTLKVGTKTIARKSVKPTRTCRYRARFTVARSRLGKATRVTATARLAKSTKTQRLSIPST